MSPAIEQPQGEIGGGFDAQERRPQPGSGVAATFDTSGRVACSAQFQPIGYCIWSDLSPFVQGYVAAMLAELDAWIDKYGDPILGPDQNPPRFSDLAPETLARIMEDCEAYALRLARPLHDDADVQRRAGGDLWRMRGSGSLNPGLAALLPPLTVYLGDDGKVRFQ